MANKNRKKTKNKGPQSQRVQALWEKGNPREALKEAKRCYRAASTKENRALLEKAYLERIAQLHRVKQIEDAKSVLADLIASQPTSPDVIQSIAEWKVLLGENKDQSQLKSDPIRLRKMVDEAILDKRSVVPDLDDLKQEIAAIREALLAVEQGADEVAAERIKAISRTSLLADWRLFVRGLSAFYQGQEERARQNWERLDSTRPGWHIAQTLLTATEQSPLPVTPEQSDVDVSRGVQQLKRLSQGQPLQTLLKEFAEAWKSQKWGTIFRHYGKLVQAYLPSHEALIRQVADLIWKRAVRIPDPQLLKKLMRFGPAPKMDPHWNRAKALLVEHPESQAPLNALEAAWKAYIADIEQGEFLPENERPIAIGLIHQRLAREFTNSARQEEDIPPFPFSTGSNEAERNALYREAAGYYRKSIQSCPKLRTSYLELVALHEEQEELDKAAKVMEKLIHQEPDCFEAACFLSHYYLANEEPEKSAPYVDTIRRLRPRDPVCDILRWNQQITTVRVHAIKRRFPEARQAIEEAAALPILDQQPFTLDLIRAGVEFKAKNLEQGNAYLDSILEQIEDPLPIWLRMDAICRRMRVARDIEKRFDANFKRDIKKTPTSAAAGAMAEFLQGIKRSKSNYTGRTTQERLLLKYLDRAVRIRWRESDLRKVCEFVLDVPRQWKLQMDCLRLGLKSFPDVPHYHYWYAMRESNRGPWFCNPQDVLNHLQTALDLHQQGPIRLSHPEYEQARSQFSIVQEFVQNSQRDGGGLFGLGGGLFGLEGDDEEEDWIDEEGTDLGEIEDSEFIQDLAELSAQSPEAFQEALKQLAVKMGIDPKMADKIINAKLNPIFDKIDMDPETGP